MRRRWFSLKPPKGLYARATLILLVPIVTLQIVVSILFVQRHFEKVTLLLSRSFATNVNYIVNEINQTGSEEETDKQAISLGADFKVNIIRGVESVETRRRYYDFTGKYVIEALQKNIPRLLWVDLAAGSFAFIGVQTDKGLIRIAVHRQRVSPSNTHQMFVWMVFTGILMTVIALIFLRNQVLPIRRLAQASEAFGKGHSVNLKIRGAREVRAATHAFLEMRERIEQHIEQRTLILSGVSHDLRTPLTRLKLGLSLIETSEAEALSRDVSEMQALIDAFLDFSKGDMTEEVQPVLISDFIRGILKGHDILPENFYLEGDGEVALRPVAIRRALGNLIENAKRFGTQVEVYVTVDRKTVTICVDDDGPGIPEDDRKRALAPFTRLDSARNQDSGSGRVGLGLAIALDIARSHGGKLELKKSPHLGGLRAKIVLLCS